MGILLIDSSSKKIEFGYADDKKFLIKEKLAHDNNADTLTYFIKKAFDENEIDFKNIEYVSLSNGPGSFTGLRISSAIAKGICFSSEAQLIEIPTLDLIADKFKSELYEFSEFPERDIISLICSNVKTGEFYFAEYKIEKRKLRRISDYKVDLPENIFIIDCNFVINEKPDESIELKFGKKLFDVSDISNLDSQFKLTKDQIQKNNFSDYRTSEPFYMKEFIPNI